MMKSRLLIVGASGHGKVVADTAKKMNRYECIEFLDDNEKLSSCLGYSIVGNQYYEEIGINDELIVAIGDPDTREHLQNDYQNRKIRMATLIHPNAIIGQHVEIGCGTVVMAGAVINSDTIIGKGVIINTASSIDHDGRIDDFVHVSVGAHLAGGVHVGNKSWIGVGAAVNNNIEICNGCIIGSGSVVVRNLMKSGVYMGTPARFKYERKENA